MKRELLYSSAIIIFVVLVIFLMNVLGMISSDLTIPFVIMVLSFVGGITLSWVSLDSAKMEGSNKYTFIFGACAALLFGFGAFLTYFVFIL